MPITVTVMSALFEDVQSSETDGFLTRSDFFPLGDVATEGQGAATEANRTSERLLYCHIGYDHRLLCRASSSAIARPCPCRAGHVAPRASAGAHVLSRPKTSSVIAAAFKCGSETSELQRCSSSSAAVGARPDDPLDVEPRTLRAFLAAGRALFEDVRNMGLLGFQNDETSGSLRALSG
jgi:hypothetical protein